MPRRPKPHDELGRRKCKKKKSTNNVLKRTEKKKKQPCKWNHMARDCDNWHLYKAGCFSYRESLWTPPLEGTSLHQWNNSVERPWGILSLFTTCLPLPVQSPCHSLWHMSSMPPKTTVRREEPRRPKPDQKDQNHKKSLAEGVRRRRALTKY